nr:MAG TPA: hypothetical protein [Caudoviricetes sp.]
MFMKSHHFCGDGFFSCHLRKGGVSDGTER